MTTNTTMICGTTSIGYSAHTYVIDLTSMQSGKPFWRVVSNNTPERRRGEAEAATPEVSLPPKKAKHGGRKPAICRPLWRP